MMVGQGAFTYELVEDWEQIPVGWRHGDVVNVACDSRDRVYLFQRFPVGCVLALDPDGRLLGRWGEGHFPQAHGIWISPKDELYLADAGSHTVGVWTTEGKHLRTYGTPDRPGAPGQPFNRPTRAVVAADGEMYVSDGYGQHRVHRFGSDGTLVRSWGEEGTGPGQFALPHDVWVDSRDRVLICDRENDRVQVFDRAGAYQTEWRSLARPMQLFEREGVLFLAAADQKVFVLTLDGERLAEWGGLGDDPRQFTNSPHSVYLDSRGSIYVTEVLVDDKVQKYTRR